MHYARGSLWWRARRSESNADRCGEGMLLGGGLRSFGRVRGDGSSRCCRCSSGHACVGDRDYWLSGTAARFVLIVDYLLQAAVLEEDVLAGVQLVACLAKLIGDADDGRGCAAVLHAGVSVARDAKVKVQWTGALEGEAQVGRHDDVARSRADCDLDSTAIERQHERSIDGA